MSRATPDRLTNLNKEIPYVKSAFDQHGIHLNFCGFFMERTNDSDNHTAFCTIYRCDLNDDLVHFFLVEHVSMYIPGMTPPRRTNFYRALGRTPEDLANKDFKIYFYRMDGQEIRQMPPDYIRMLLQPY